MSVKRVFSTLLESNIDSALEFIMDKTTDSITNAEKLQVANLLESVAKRIKIDVCKSEVQKLTAEDDGSSYVPLIQGSNNSNFIGKIKKAELDYDSIAGLL